jgi:hypothetical protein
MAYDRSVFPPYRQLGDGLWKIVNELNPVVSDLEAEVSRTSSLDGFSADSRTSVDMREGVQREFTAEPDTLMSTIPCLLRLRIQRRNGTRRRQPLLFRQSSDRW